MEEVLTDDLVDLKDHCLLCFLPIPMTDDDELEEGEVDTCSRQNLSKLGIKLLCRELNLPRARLTVLNEDENDPTPSTIRKEWERLIKGNLCDGCYESMDYYCSLVSQKNKIELQLQDRTQEIFHKLCLVDHDSRSAEGRALLREKWQEDGVDSQHSFTLLDRMREDIIARVSKQKSYPLISIPRLPDSECQERMASLKKLEHRLSIAGDSGVSSSSPSSTNTYDDETFPEYKVIRFSCNGCKKKFLTKDSRDEHYNAAHSKKSIPSKASPSSSPQKKVFKMKKMTFRCPTCKDIFLSKELVEDHITKNHADLHHPFANIPPPSDAQHEQVTPMETEASTSHIIQGNNQVEEEANSQEYSTGNETHEEAQISPSRKYRKLQVICNFSGCNSKFHDTTELEIHSFFHKSQSCSKCRKVCKNPAELASHELKEHKKLGTSKVNNVPCPRCNFEARNFTQYRSHFYTHLGNNIPEPKMHQCSHCERTYYSKGALQRHTKTAHEISLDSNMTDDTNDNINDDIMDDESQQSDQSESSGEKRSSTLITKNDYTCNICNLVCPTFNYLHSHMVGAHDPNTHCCDECERMFGNAKAYDTHLAMIHLKCKIFVKMCTFCKLRKNFRSKEAFDAHIREHQNNRMRGARERKNLTCPICSLSFRNLGAHMRSHGKVSEDVHASSSEGSSISSSQSPDSVDSEGSMSSNRAAGDDNNPVEDEQQATCLDNSGLALADRVKLRQRRAKRSKAPRKVTKKGLKKRRKRRRHEAVGSGERPSQNIVEHQEVNDNETQNEAERSQGHQEDEENNAQQAIVVKQEPQSLVKAELHSPKQVDSSLVGERLGSWMEKHRSFTSESPGSKDVADAEVVDLVSTDEDEAKDEEKELKPSYSNANLSERVQNWLNERNNVQIMPTPPRPRQVASEQDVVNLDEN